MDDLSGWSRVLAARLSGRSTASRRNEHDLRTADDHYVGALEVPADTLQIPMQSAAESARNEPSEKSEPLATAERYEGLRYCPPVRVGDEGLEKGRRSSKNTHDAEQGGAERGAKVCKNAGSTTSPPAAFDSRLADVIRAWPALPEASRQAIFGIIRDSK